MKKKFIIFTLCFTLIFSSLNYKKTYADGGVISLPMLATVSALAVGTGIVIQNTDDLYDIGCLFYDYIKTHNSYTWESVKLAFEGVKALSSGLVSVDSPFLNIVKDFFDSTFLDDRNIILDGYNSNNFPSKVLNVPIDLLKGTYDSITNTFTGGLVVGDMKFILTDTSMNSSTKFYIVRSSDNKVLRSSSAICRKEFFNYVVTGFNAQGLLQFETDLINSNEDVWTTFTYSSTATEIIGGFADFPYNGGYTWDNVESKKENESVALPIPGDLGQLVGQNKDSFWDNTDNLVGVGGISSPSVSNPSIGVIDGTFVGGGVSDPSLPGDSVVPNDSLFAKIKDFIISLVVPNDAFWTDTWGGLYNNFTDSFPMVDMSGFNDLVTGEKKFPNIDINVMGVTGRVVNGDVINSIVDWLRPIIAGFMMICLMLFNYRKIYKLIRNTEPFGGIAPGTSDFSTGISEYSHIGLVNDGFKRSEEEEFARSRYYEEMHFRNGGKL